MPQPSGDYAHSANEGGRRGDVDLAADVTTGAVKAAREDREDEAKPSRLFSANNVVGLGFIAVGALALWAGRDLALMADNHPGAGMLPFGLSVLLIAGGLLMVARQIAVPAPGPAAPRMLTVVRVVAVIAILAVTVILFERVGFIIAVALMLAAILFGVERKFTIASVLVVVGTPLVCWALFAELLGVQLPPLPF